MHGYFEFSGYESMHELIRHTVRTGTIVVYPRWQTDVADPCPGPFDIEPCVQSSVDGILGALSHLESDDSRVQPDLEQVSYFGFSFGAILAANLASRHEALGLPTPRAVFLDDPADSGLAGPGEPALDDSLAGIPPETLFVCHSSAEGAYSREEGDPAQRSCNAVFARIDHVPSANKSLVMTSTDRHGVPALEARHGVCAAPRGQADAYDWNFCWTTWDALRSASVDGPDRRYALGNTPEQRDLGSWSDGTAITPLKVQDEGPILP
jgi:pimeloyl-ACP methyl ester carboxylesterase